MDGDLLLTLTSSQAILSVPFVSWEQQAVFDEAGKLRDADVSLFLFVQRRMIVQRSTAASPSCRINSVVHV